MVKDEKNRHSRMQRKIKVTMPKSKKQLEHAYTFSMMEESIISDLRSKEIKFTIPQKNDLCFQDQN